MGDGETLTFLDRSICTNYLLLLFTDTVSSLHQVKRYNYNSRFNLKENETFHLSLC